MAGIDAVLTTGLLIWFSIVIRIWVGGVGHAASSLQDLLNLQVLKAILRKCKKVQVIGGLLIATDLRLNLSMVQAHISTPSSKIRSKEYKGSAGLAYCHFQRYKVLTGL